MRWVADLVLIAHAVFVAFIVFGQLLVLIGWWRGWRWVRNLWFRLAHLFAISLVVLESWFGIPCPLTVLENMLRIGADDTPYAGSFIGYWLQRLIFYDAPPAVFLWLYTGFFALVIATLIGCRPRLLGK